MTDRQVFPRSLVTDVLLSLWRRFDPALAWHRPDSLVERMCAVGGYRRRKEAMKDLEILYIPKIRAAGTKADLFGAEGEVNLTDQLLDRLLAEGVLAPRLKTNGTKSWGPTNKFAVHCATGLPIDLFAATAENWVNRMVVTTGPRESNIRVASEARKRGWEWEVYESGFVPLGQKWSSCAPDRRTVVTSEAQVFAFVGLPALPPDQRQ